MNPRRPAATRDFSALPDPMHNLLKAPLDESALAALLARGAGARVLPAHDAAEWTALRARPEAIAPLREMFARAVGESDAPMPELTDELYADFFRTGARLPFERPYNERRRRLGRAALAYLLDPDADRPRLLASLVAKLAATLDEPSWSLPAHVWTEPTGKNPLQIDLRAADAAIQCAELVAIFGPLLPPPLVARVRARLREQIFSNYVERHEAMHWARLPMNWNAVCHFGVLGAALTIEDDHALVARILALAARSLPLFLGGFEPDGATSEGPGYWAYGFGWFAELNERLEARSGGALSFFEDDDHIARIARFAPLLCLDGGAFVNFSDGPRHGRLPPGLLAYLGRRLGDSMITAEAGAGYAHLARAGISPDDSQYEFPRLLRLALRTPARLPRAAEPARPDVYFPDYGAVVVRGADARGHRWEFAAKAGHNDEHHNHNDCGSFLLNVDAAPALLEIGAPEYVKGYFGVAQRYEFLAARSLGHSVPFVNGQEQPEGRAFAAKVVEAELAPHRGRFVVDLAAAYPAAAGCLRLLRSFHFDKAAGRLSVRDDYELSAPGVFESVIICRDAVARVGDEMHLRGEGTPLRLAPEPGCAWGGIERCDYRDHFGQPDTVARLRLRPAAGAAPRGSVGFTVTIL